MSDLGRETVKSLEEWHDMPSVTLARWQWRMVLQGLARAYDDYHSKRPSTGLPVVQAMAKDEIVALIHATINDIGLQLEIVRDSDISIVSPTHTFAPAPAGEGS